MVHEIPSGVTAPAGFSAAGTHCGIKRSRRDVAIIHSHTPAVAAGVFTASRVQAAPVLVSKQQLRSSSTARAIVINSGNANACTGERGLNDAWAMAEACATALGIRRTDVLVSSTGVIGQYLPMDKLIPGIAHCARALDGTGSHDAAEAIMTTDTFPKELAVRVPLRSGTIVLGGIAKGSGMIAPNMATMLAFITTDVDLPPAVLRNALRKATDRSFNRITVDGDTSTNDMVLMLANGMSGIRLEDPGSEDFIRFYNALEYVLIRLSKMIVMDGEGATKFIEITVAGAATEQAAVQAAKAIANSNLVKTAIHGQDANWGRILAAVGYSGIEFEPAEVEIFFGNVPILQRNYAIDFSEADATRILQQKEISITVDLHQGQSAASVWTCDLTREYVEINAHYRT